MTGKYVRPMVAVWFSVAASLSCASGFGATPDDPRRVAGVEVFNYLSVSIGVYLDGALLGYVSPSDKECIYVPIPNRERVLRFLSTGGSTLHDIAHTVPTPFHQRPDWVVIVSRGSIAPIVPAPGGECAPDGG